MVLVFTRDTGEARDVLGSLTHRDVDVGDQAVFAGIVPRGSAALGGAFGAGQRLVEQRVLGIGRTVGAAGDGEARHALDATRDEHVTLAGLDGVQGHAGGLQRRRAVAVHGDTGDVVEAEFDAEHAGDVVAALAAGLADSPVDVFDFLGVELGDLGEKCGDDLAREFVGANVFEGSLSGTADRGAGMGNDDSFRHVKHVTGQLGCQMSRICHSSERGAFDAVSGWTRGKKTSSTMVRRTSSDTGFRDMSTS